MTYQNFLNEIRSRIQQQLDPACKIHIQPVTKNNGITYDGMSIFYPSMNVSPTIYLNPYYARYLDGVPLEDIVSDICATYKEYLPECDMNMDDFLDFEKAKGKIVMKLVNADRNRKLLETVPSIPFLNLRIVFLYAMELPGMGSGTILISREIMERWEITPEDLYRLALENMPRLYPGQVSSLSSFLRELARKKDCPEEFLSDITENDPDALPMYMLTNRSMSFGASAVLYPNMLKDLCQAFDSSLILLPSSIHEMIVIPSSAPDLAAEAHSFNEMISTINETEVEDCEILSDNAYYYDRELGELRMAV